MEAACRRLCQGDTSSLPDIVDCIEAGQQAPTGKLGARAYTALATLMLREGVVLRKSYASNSALPSREAFYALRILAVLGARHAQEGHDVKSVLLSLGLQQCRDMKLDAYFALRRRQQYYVIMFVTLLIGVYGCRPQDLLQNATSLNVMTGSTDFGRLPPHLEGQIEYTELIPALPHHTARVAAAAAGCSGGRTSLTAPTNHQPHGATSGSGSPPRCAGVQNRRSLLISIPGTSTDLPLQPTRWYREFPRKPINVPYPVNPLYVNVALREGSSGATAAGGTTCDDGDGDGVSPAFQSLVAEIPMTAQFPTPVVLFSVYYGVGCVPRLPTLDDLARLHAWRERKQQEQAASTPGTDFSSRTLLAEHRHGWGSILEAAVQIREPDVAAEGDDPHLFAVRNEMAFMSPSASAVAYHRQCLGSSLLRHYLEEGKLLSWGSLAKGALGQHRQRHRRSPHELRKSVAVSSDPAGSNAKVGGAAPASVNAKQQYSSSPDASALGSNEGEASLVGGGSPTAGSLVSVSKVSLARRLSTMDTLSETRPGGRCVTDQFQASPSAGLPKATSTAFAGALAVSATSLDDTGATGYVYLPSYVHTAARVAQVACGLAVTYVLTVDGALYSCGRADNGQLGIGEGSARYSDAGVSKLQRVLLKDNERVTRIAAGTACAMALTGDSALYCWGHNVYGQCLTMPEASHVSTPVRLKAGVHKILDVCFGQFFGVLLFDDGVMGTWGVASMLGCNMSGKRLEQSLASDQCKCSRQIVHLQLATPTPMAAVRAGPWHALAISQKGEVYTWGVGRNGRLGHGTDNSEVKPRLVEGLRSSFVVDASCSNAHSAVLTSTGAVYVFGENAEGQLGLRGREPRRLPTMVPLPMKAVAVTCAREHTCILLADGDVVACGSYRTCGLGLGYGRQLCAASRILTNYVTLTLHCGHLQSMAGVVHRRTSVMVVGHSTIEKMSRVSSLIVRSGVRCAGSGAGFLVVLSESNSLVAIGRGERGQLGIGDCMKPNRRDDVTVAAAFREVQIPSDVVIQHVRCGPDFVLALDTSGVVYGWGSNDHRKLCQPADVAQVFSPVRIAAYTSERIVQIVCGGTFVVALTADGEVLTHGEAIYCGLGAPTSPTKAKGSDVPVPMRVAGLSDIVAVAAGLHHAVAMTASCSVFAWGVGVLGTGSTADVSDSTLFTSVTPAPVRVALSQTIRSIGCGPNNSFAISDEGELWVWGVNRFGECGMPTSGKGASIGTGGGALQRLAARQKQGSDAAADHASVIATPTAVARQVRDAAFTGEFGVVVFEDGQVSVSGRIRYGGQRYLLSSFHSTPQPPFSIDVNESVWRSPTEPRTSFSTSLLGSGGGGASAAVATEPRQQEHQGNADADGAFKNDREPSPSSYVGLPAAGKSAMLPTDGQHQHRPQPPSPPRSYAAGMGMAAASPTSARASKSPPHRASLSLPLMTRGRGSPTVPSSRAATIVGEPAPLAAPSNPLLSIPSPRLGARDATPLDHGHDMMSAYSLPSISGLIPSAQGSMPQAATAVTLGTMDAEGVRSGTDSGVYTVDEEAQTNLASSGAYLNSGEYSAADTMTLLSNAEVSSEADACTPMPLRRASDGATPSPVRAKTSRVARARKPLSATWDTLDTRAPPMLPLSPDHSVAQSADVGVAAASSTVTTARATAMAQVRAQTPSRIHPAQRGPKVRAAATSKLPKPSLSSPPPPSAADERIVGIRCFAGWEQICIVMEKYRPSAAEVGMAQTGLQVLLRQSENAVREA
ncbi:conserved hypothetical protein [Leishmania major strain Friedlin]|uniref:RCC1-like domain-containing protein n=1 Tax=Leishmania major TaxID=5664 RepID=Q4Q9B9_LEIMA|nr:conserved hypothetical protein [Leishmania major strain Friedlin]CAJ04887.1 conserved hypothetical protein [Leishmania major strain Friedlin]|eukprot:XP_001684079.1 conserved hypothetical protein [Leishmania major strain Friedlin]